MFSFHSAPRLLVAGHVLKRGLGRRSKSVAALQAELFLKWSSIDQEK